jgi:hypothetical protein
MLAAQSPEEEEDEDEEVDDDIGAPTVPPV